ncbi:hypothetical protein [Lactococcus termiticola]|uniref:Uncharacterized protein n=1 Tax=Lactococcus termiticola TaxID=2169526 RepID=A0A2R5HHD9_9LACT|nr:hypothetical protein [Lactococcus termiticola]GBG96765.1 hypothetical protein NtB2_00889 [Lactococcus termiticola]
MNQSKSESGLVCLLLNILFVASLAIFDLLDGRYWQLLATLSPLFVTGAVITALIVEYKKPKAWQKKCCRIYIFALLLIAFAVISMVIRIPEGHLLLKFFQLMNLYEIGKYIIKEMKRITI